MSMLSVSEAADRLGLSDQMVRRHAASGQLAGARVGSTWVFLSRALDEFDRSRKGPGRPFSPVMARAMVDLISQHLGDQPGSDWLGLDANQKSRLRGRWRRLRSADEPAELLRAWLPHRDRQLRHTFPDDRGLLLADDRAVAGGGADPRMGMSGGRRLDLHLAESDVDRFVDDYLLLPDPQGDVVLHVRPTQHCSIGACLVDLAQEGGPRQDAAVARFLR